MVSERRPARGGGDPAAPAPLTLDEVHGLAATWGAEAGSGLVSPTVHEFDLGYVVREEPAVGGSPRRGGPCIVVDRTSGDVSVWPALPTEQVVERFRRRRAARPPVPRTWHPLDEARWTMQRRPVTPTNVTHLTLKDRVVIAQGVKSEAEPNLHPLVRAFLTEELAFEHRERGRDRCSEAAAFSDALHAEDARRVAARQQPITVAEARDGLFRGTGMVTYRIREPGDPVAGESAPPCISCALLSRHFGFELRPPWEQDGADDA